MDSNNNKTVFKGMVRWIDSLSGDGVVRRNDGQSFKVHFTAIKNINKNNYQYPTQDDQIKLAYVEGRQCEFTLLEDSHFTQIDYCKIEGI